MLTHTQRMLLAAASRASTGAFVNRYTVSTLCGLDLADERDADAWQHFSIEFILSAVEWERSLLHPLLRPCLQPRIQEALDAPGGNAAG